MWFEYTLKDRNFYDKELGPKNAADWSYHK